MDVLDNLSNIREIMCPVLIIHGTQDWVVPYKNSQLLFERYVAAHQPQVVLTKGEAANEIVENGSFFHKVIQVKYGSCEFDTIVGAGHNDLDSTYR